jgi:hypothetical protein
MKKQYSFAYGRQCSTGFLVALITFFLVGCAGGSAKQLSHYQGSEPLPRPSAIYIYNFAVNSNDVVVDTFGPNFMSKDKADISKQMQEGRNVANALADQLVIKLTKVGITARRAEMSTNIPINAFVVKGQFVTIDAGDETARVIIGFGAGAEKLTAQAQVYQAKENGLQQVGSSEAEAHGRKTPGVAGPAAVAIGAGMVVGVVVSSVMNIKSEAIDGSMKTNVSNLAEQFVKNAVRFYEQQGWM